MLNYLPDRDLNNLQSIDRLWWNFRNGSIPIAQVINQSTEPLLNLDYDVIIVGGTLGIILACALQKQGLNICVIERGILRGREQEWNISRHELQTLIELEILTASELEKTIFTEYNPGRISFPQTPDIWVKDILNIGVSPVTLLEIIKSKFIALGGKLLENNPFKNLTIHPNGVKVTTEINQITSKIIIDVMGHFSPLVSQVRKGQKPDGICLVVGTCGDGYKNNDTGDIFVSLNRIENQCQYFWEAFPAKDGRTTYLFTYMDAELARPSLEFIWSEYLRLLPNYQGIDIEEINFKRYLFGFFPSYQNNPLKTPIDRLLFVGDSSGSQSPVSFGGFGSLIRHLPRLTQGIKEAIEFDCLDKKSLQLLQPYQPNISVTWMFQKAMSVGINQQLNPDQINELLAGVFLAMEELGDDVLLPFLQDVVKFNGLTKTLLTTSIKSPQVVLPVIPHVGMNTLLNWSIHYLKLASYTMLNYLSPALKKISDNDNLAASQKYLMNRLIDAWEYGSGNK